MSEARATRFETFEHVSDIGVRGVGPTLEAAFEQAAVALTSIVCDPAAVRPIDQVDLSCELPEPDDEALLVTWLNAVIFEMATRSMLFARFSVSIDGGRLRARAAGEKARSLPRPAQSAGAAEWSPLNEPSRSRSRLAWMMAPASG